MLLTEYLSGLTDSIAGYAGTGLILSSEFAVDSRTDKIGLIKGTVAFLDGSKLFFSEYLDLRYKTRKLSYVFHYQDTGNTMIFRYDNAAHRPALPFADHKHSGNYVRQSEIPELSSVLREIIERLTLSA